MGVALHRFECGLAQRMPARLLKTCTCIAVHAHQRLSCGLLLIARSCAAATAACQVVDTSCMGSCLDACDQNSDTFHAFLRHQGEMKCALHWAGLHGDGVAAGGASTLIGSSTGCVCAQPSSTAVRGCCGSCSMRHAAPQAAYEAWHATCKLPGSHSFTHRRFVVALSLYSMRAGRCMDLHLQLP